MQQGFSKRSEFAASQKRTQLAMEAKAKKQARSCEEEGLHMSRKKLCSSSPFASSWRSNLTGVKKHFSRKHGEKKWKCEKCSKKYAVQSDWKAHSKICGTREYRCDCGTLFSRKDSFITHRAFWDPLTEENSRISSFAMVQTTTNRNFPNDLMMVNGGGRIMNPGMKPMLPVWLQYNDNNPLENSTTSSSFFRSSSSNNHINGGILSSEMMKLLSGSHETVGNITGLPQGPAPPVPPPPHMSATALLQKASQMGSTRSTNSGGMMMAGGVDSGEGNLTRDFLGVEGNERREYSLQQEVMKFTCTMNDSSIGFSGN
ncbi:hypothetical protein L1987_25506 [Smallanthus sonchifolius]|uniref:Uncharacterized protein n=1 Tax=Smallanthus sonchifolius TaxID=185202 RepID=A0ACB9IMN2_9ASTR|nr:hypothetical protein L1987_25506 [Smallanthus sonchifolius]